MRLCFFFYFLYFYYIITPILTTSLLIYIILEQPNDFSKKFAVKCYVMWNWNGLSIVPVLSITWYDNSLPLSSAMFSRFGEIVTRFHWRDRYRIALERLLHGCTWEIVTGLHLRDCYRIALERSLQDYTGEIVTRLHWRDPYKIALERSLQDSTREIVSEAGLGH